jgi:hypothetical protein
VNLAYGVLNLETQIEKGRSAQPQTTLEVSGMTIAELGHRNSFGRANIDACAAIAASVVVDDGQAVLHLDRIERARFDTGFAPSAFCLINYCCHEKTPIMKIDGYRRAKRHRKTDFRAKIMIALLPKMPKYPIQRRSQVPLPTDSHFQGAFVKLRREN